jgi:hypothetical protein
MVDFQVVAGYCRNLPGGSGLCGSGEPSVGFEGDQKRKMRTLAALFLVALGVAAVVSNQVQKSVDSANAKKDQGKLQNSVDDLGGQLQDEKLSHTAEAQYLRGRLDQLSQFTPAILKLAQASEENTRKMYEQKVVSNKDLRDFTAGVVAKMRDLDRRQKMAEQQAEDKWDARVREALPPPNASSTEREQALQKLGPLRNQEWTERTQIQMMFENECRQNILGDSIFAREQLLTKLGAKEEPQTVLRPILLLDGSFAGVDPIGEAATYLELFAKKLSP